MSWSQYILNTFSTRSLHNDTNAPSQPTILTLADTDKPSYHSSPLHASFYLNTSTITHSHPIDYAMFYPSSDGGYEIDAKECGNLTRFINHSTGDSRFQQTQF